MNYIKSAGKILLYLLIYYGFQLLFFLILGVDALLKGLSNTEMESYIYKNSGLMMILSMIISLIIYFFILRNKENNVFKRYNFKNIGIKNIMLIIVICISFSMILSGIVEYVIKFFPSYNETSKMISMSMNSILGILAVLLFAPIFEEILFRGMVLGEIKNKVNITAAIIIQGVLFGIYHMNLFQSIYAGVLGILLGFICVKAGSIVGSIIAHITFNICGSTVLPYLVELSGKFAFLYIIAGVLIFIISLYKFNRCNILNRNGIYD
ncbi:CAAX amino protease family protein [Clostridium pasteurianum DSM 525 = ATCC 6013]|uniref:Abortive infection protein n=1 Tax=Clostridium pasteurianum DSM 525 = ATCC 6013 TaxID=1262449 RepID=A0A0H3J2C3_CLOPA|nr:CPBP family intramembrane glutamic endopeptidase [Clostridium pasteurianum]AJA47579.1 CAAX amino protease family protein [Clostridium pasteurianum DSM 525 = ATCC 6013]AJA51567.1 CAAX amino protease family protein [Clostridium pasteurianum DSM 525 = ATCC 6013]AOZ74894.1 CAAX protease [Clostridium pasteurianum DSM 525 = ATCC 6013]AOZ78689.1 CAAX protease [Clostridium pasteurianum]ELP58080.1 CAAX amino protease family protein [Clostridium pasteurianum DSM 525 = ATCC 6013]